MKTSLSILLALGGAIAVPNISAHETASCCTSKTQALLSPRAQMNQTVIAGKPDADLARTQLGAGARSKAFGGSTASLAGSAVKDVDHLRGRYNLGVAAKEKATGTTSESAIQIAPLK